MRYLDELIETLLLCGMAMFCHIRPVTLCPLDHLLVTVLVTVLVTTFSNVPVYWKNNMIYNT